MYVGTKQSLVTQRPTSHLTPYARVPSGKQSTYNEHLDCKQLHEVQSCVCLTSTIRNNEHQVMDVYLYYELVSTHSDVRALVSTHSDIRSKEQVYMESAKLHTSLHSFIAQKVASGCICIVPQHQCLSMFFKVTAAAGFFLLRPLKIQYLKRASIVTGTIATNV